VTSVSDPRFDPRCLLRATCGFAPLRRASQLWPAFAALRCSASYARAVNVSYRSFETRRSVFLVGDVKSETTGVSNGLPIRQKRLAWFTTGPWTVDCAQVHRNRHFYPHD
jgi:hypothetical protein